jgi:hypothetical protein
MVYFTSVGFQFFDAHMRERKIKLDLVIGSLMPIS